MIMSPGPFDFLELDVNKSGLNRRAFMTLSAGVTAVAGTSSTRAASDSELLVCMHGITSSGSDFRTCMEGWARAGIRFAEPDLASARTFEEANGQGSARQLIDDLGIRAVSSTNCLFLDENGPRRDNAIEELKWKVAMAESIGADRLVIPSAASAEHSMADFSEAMDNLAEAAEIARPHNVSLMLEFTRLSTLVSNLRTSLHLIRTINHPNLRFMIDVYHFWAGTSKFEDLDLIEPGEIHHVHFADTPSMPHLEVAERKDRAFPGEGIAPLQKIVDKLLEKGYLGPLSLELFDPEIQNSDPEVIAARAIETITPFIS